MSAAATPLSNPPPVASTSKAGRNLPAAVAVGVLLVSLIISSLVVVQWGFVALATASLMIGVWELRGGLASGHVHIPVIPVLAGTLAMGPAAYVGGGTALSITFGLTVLAVIAWRAAGGLDGASRDITGGVFVVAYAPFLAAFSALMAAAPEGPKRIFVFVAVTVMSDIGGYAVGVLAGRHPMAPSVSPKKSWEGFAGSTVACVLMGAAAVPLLLGGPVWAGVVLGLITVVIATMGDLAESMVKRDLGIKDMGSLLPGHGGIMDRLDSLLLVVPFAWALLALWVPVA